jgi:hypothetical protein
MRRNEMQGDFVSAQASIECRLSILKRAREAEHVAVMLDALCYVADDEYGRGTYLIAGSAVIGHSWSGSNANTQDIIAKLCTLPGQPSQECDARRHPKDRRPDRRHRPSRREESWRRVGIAPPCECPPAAKADIPAGDAGR